LMLLVACGRDKLIGLEEHDESSTLSIGD